MDFDKFSQLFKTTVTTILDSSQLIEEKHIKDVAGLLRIYTKFRIESYQIKVFLDNVLFFFTLLNNYVKQFDEVSALQHFMVRMALGVFVCVIDSMKIHQSIVSTFRKIIDIVVENESHSSNLKEFLRIYSYLLEKVSVDILEKLAIKHQAYPTLYKILEETSDIETQAIIVEVVLKLLKSKRFIDVDNDFNELIQLIDVNGSQTNMYQNIRMILDHVNGNLTKMFSINCSTIELDSNRIIEFHGAGVTDDVWLDINLVDHRLSFFCDKNFVSSVDEVKFYSSSTWEVLCFCTKDILKIVFNYNTMTENLNITMILNTSSFNIFVSSKVDRQRKLQISVSRYSDKFYKLVEDILPRIFPDTFSAELLKIPTKESDSSATASDLVKNNAADDSSPVIEHFSEIKKYSTRHSSSPIVVLSGSENSDSDSVVLISDDEATVLAPETQTTKNSLCNGNLTSLLLEQLAETSEQKNNGTKRYNLKRCSENDDENHFNKTGSCLSFTESVFARSRPPSRNSKSDTILEKQAKISSLNENLNQNEGVKNKISVSKIIELKISSSITSPIIKKDSEVKKKKCRKRLSKTSPFLIAEEVLDKSVAENLIDEDVLNSSIFKVKDWLNKVNPDNMVINEKELVEIPILPERPSNLEIVSDDLPSVSTRNTGRSIPPEEKIEIMMREDEESENKKEKSYSVLNNNTSGINVNHTVTDLLKILSDGGAEEVENLQPLEKLQINDVNDSDVPLLEMVNRWKDAEIQENLQIAHHEDVSEKPSAPNHVEEVEPDDDVTPDLDLKDVKLKKDSSANETLNNISLLSETAKPSSIKRKLYNPEDLSYLNATITEEYLKSSDKNRIVVIQSRGTPAAAKSSKRKPREKKIKTKKAEKSKKENKSNLTNSKTKSVNIFEKSHSSLKQKLRNFKRERKRADRERVQSSSSSSSMVPFGVALKDIRKRKSTGLDNSNDSKRLNKGVNETNKKENGKIRIISNVLIQPASSDLLTQSRPDDSYENLVKMTSQFYLKFIKYIEHSRPALLKNGECNEIVAILQDSANQR